MSLLKPHTQSVPAIGLLGFVLLIATGCNRDARAAKVLYADAHRCAHVLVHKVSRGAYRAIGCGSDTLYKCKHGACVAQVREDQPARTGRGSVTKHEASRVNRSSRSRQVLASQGKLDDLKISLIKQGTDTLVVERQGPGRLFRKCQGARVTPAGQASESGLPLATTIRSMPVGGNQYSETFKIKMTPAAVQTLAQGNAPVLHMCGQQHAISEEFSAAVAEGMKKTISTTLNLKRLKMVFQARPADAGEEVWLGFSIRSPKHEYAQCDIAVLANGEPMDLPGFTYKKRGPHDAYQARVDLERLVEIVEHARTVGRVCDVRFELSDEHREKVAMFLMRFKEERAFAGGGAMVSPNRSPPRPRPEAPRSRCCCQSLLGQRCGEPGSAS